jgi:hypothetical protein
MERMKHISEIGLTKKLLREAKAATVTPAKQKIIDAAAVIRLDPNASDKAYMASYLVQCTLPPATPATWSFGGGGTAIYRSAFSADGTLS